MRRIAFLSFDWNYETMALYYEGMEECLRGMDDVQLFVFNASGQSASYESDEGSLELFDLCDIERYDGFLIQGNRAWPPEMRQAVVDDILRLGKPVVSVNYQLDGATIVGTDNYDAEFGLVSKVLSEKGCTRPAFVNGLISSWEAKDRSQAFWSACTERGIASPRYYQASWEMESGVETALKILRAPDDLPDVIFCCNDDLAVGVQTTLQEHGVRVPEDVYVTGFDNREMGRRAQPRITTVDRDYRSIGARALQTVMALLDGADVPPFVVSDARYVLSESCGYPAKGESRVSADDVHSENTALSRFFEVLSKFQPSVLNADSLLEVIIACERYLPELGCPNAYLTLNEGYLGADAALASVPYGLHALLVAHSGTSVKTGCDERHVYESFRSRDILPRELSTGGGMHMVYPLRRGTACMGTLVTEGVSPLLGRGFISIILTLLSSAIEGAHRREAS